MYICDCHCDTLTVGGQDLQRNQSHWDVERTIGNGGGLQFLALYIPREYTRCGALRFALRYIDYFYNQLAQWRQQGLPFLQVLSRQDVAEACNYHFSALLSVEDGAVLEGSLEVLNILYRLGVRSLTLTWNDRNELGDGASETVTRGGLTQFGRQVIQRMNQIGMVIDVSHLSPQGFWDVVELSDKPILASHSNAKTLCDTPRNLTDRQLQAIGVRGGVVGVNFNAGFLEEHGHRATIDSIYRHIDYMISWTGEDHVGFGTDFDGIQDLPEAVAGVQNMPDVLDYLLRKNYPQRVVEKVAWRNVMRLLSETL